MINRIAAIALLLAALAIQSIRAAPPAAADAKALLAGNRQECLKCLADLDHADYVVRRQAAVRLHDMAADPVTAAIIAGEIAERWQSPDLSAEARAALKPLVSVLRPQSTDASTERSDFAASSLIEQLTSGDFAARAAAERQLKSALRSSTCMAPLRAELRIRLADPELSPADRTTLIDA